MSGYPTLKWFKGGQSFDYDGPRREEGKQASVLSGVLYTL